jgi:hypothetical protein
LLNDHEERHRREQASEVEGERKRYHSTEMETAVQLNNITCANGELPIGEFFEEANDSHVCGDIAMYLRSTMRSLPKVYTPVVPAHPSLILRIPNSHALPLKRPSYSTYARKRGWRNGDCNEENSDTRSKEAKRIGQRRDV